MFTFLNSAILFGLAAVSIPILIHLFTRRQVKRIDFSSLRFLKELQKQQIRRLKLKQILLLILRALIILFLVLAFARPTLRSSNFGSAQSSANLCAVIILDNTMSMGRLDENKRLLDRAKNRAIEIIKLMRPGDEVYLLYPQDPPKFAYEGARYNLEKVEEEIEETEIAYTGTGYIEALKKANQLILESGKINREIYLISDLQRNGLKSIAENGSAILNKDIQLFILPIVKENYENLTVTDVQITNQILEKNKVFEVSTEIKNTGSRDVIEKLVHLFVNGKRIGQNVVSLDAGTSTKIVFNVVPEHTGYQSGYILLEDDDLNEDNRRYFLFNIPSEINVFLVGPSDADTRFFELGLNPQNSQTNIKTKRISPADLSGIILNDAQVIILSNIPRFDDVTVRRLLEFVNNGGGVFIFPGSDADLKNYNTVLHDKFQIPAVAQAFPAVDQEQFLSFGKIDFEHPLFKDVFDEKKHVESPHIRFAVKVTQDQNISEIIEYSNGDPFLFEKGFENGRILYVTTGIGLEWSDLAVRAFFVPLVNRGVRYLAGANSTFEQKQIGEELSAFTGRDDNVTDLHVEKPDAETVKIKPDVVRGKYFVRFKETDLPGIYKMMNQEDVRAQWAVNFDEAESEVIVVKTEGLKQRLNHELVHEISEPANIKPVLEQSRFGREIWHILIAITLILLLLETVLFRERAAG